MTNLAIKATKVVLFKKICNFHVHTVYLDIIKVFYSPTDEQVKCFKQILKFTLKLTLKQLRHVSVLQLHHHQGAH